MSGEQPGIGRRLLMGWLVIAARFGEVQTLVILAIFYALLIGPAGVISKAARRDMLQKRPLLDEPTAWSEADTAEPDLERSKLQT